MERIPKQRYTKEFKEEAVKLVREGGLTLPEAARRLSLPDQTLRNWVNLAENGKLGLSEKKPVSPLEAEVSRLRKELAETRLESEILKKAMAYLAKGSLPGTRK